MPRSDAASEDPGRIRRGRRARRLGRRGERAARRALRRAGYRILAKNLRLPDGETDILAMEGPRLVLVEVKTRTAGPFRGATRAQRARLARCARWLGRRAGRPVRGDLVDVHYEGRRPVVTIHRGAL